MQQPYGRRKLLTTLSLIIGLGWCQAQTDALQIIHYDVIGNISNMQEKQILEYVSDLGEASKLSVDRITSQLKVKVPATATSGSIVSVVSQFGVEIKPKAIIDQNLNDQ